MSNCSAETIKGYIVYFVDYGAKELVIHAHIYYTVIEWPDKPTASHLKGWESEKSPCVWAAARLVL